MSIYKRKGTGAPAFQVRVFKGRDADGRLRFAFQTFATQKEAKAWKASTQKDVHEGVHTEPTKTTLSAFFAQCIEGARLHLKVQTVKQYDDSFRLYIAPHLGRLQLQAVTPVAIKACYGKLVAQGLKPSTIKGASIALRACLRNAVADRYLAHNPMIGLKRPKAQGEKAKVRCWMNHQLRWRPTACATKMPATAGFSFAGNSTERQEKPPTHPPRSTLIDQRHRL